MQNNNLGLTDQLNAAQPDRPRTPPPRPIVPLQQLTSYQSQSLVLPPAINYGSRPSSSSTVASIMAPSSSQQSKESPANLNSLRVDPPGSAAASTCLWRDTSHSDISTLASVMSSYKEMPQTTHNSVNTISQTAAVIAQRLLEENETNGGMEIHNGDSTGTSEVKKTVKLPVTTHTATQGNLGRTSVPLADKAYQQDSAPGQKSYTSGLLNRSSSAPADLQAAATKSASVNMTEQLANKYHQFLLIM